MSGPRTQVCHCLCVSDASNLLFANQDWKGPSTETNKNKNNSKRQAKAGGARQRQRKIRPGESKCKAEAKEKQRDMVKHGRMGTNDKDGEKTKGVVKVFLRVRQL